MLMLMMKMKTTGAVAVLLLGSALAVLADQGCGPHIGTDPELKELKTDMEAMMTRLRAVEKKAVTMNIRLGGAEKKLHRLQTRKVAFSVSLQESTDKEMGPVPHGQTLVFKHILTNIGNAYNKETGFFTAPMRGVYDLSFFIIGRNSQRVGAYLRKNKTNLVMAWVSTGAAEVGPSNGVTVQLEAGDEVDVYLPANMMVVDNGNHHATFKGHLLFEI